MRLQKILIKLSGFIELWRRSFCFFEKYKNLLILPSMSKSQARMDDGIRWFSAEKKHDRNPEIQGLMPSPVISNLPIIGDRYNRFDPRPIPI